MLAQAVNEVAISSALSGTYLPLMVLIAAPAVSLFGAVNETSGPLQIMQAVTITGELQPSYVFCSQKQFIKPPFTGLSGYATVPELDLGRIVGLVSIISPGRLTLLNLTLVNSPSDPNSYPNGMMTALPWFVIFSG